MKNNQYYKWDVIWAYLPHDNTGMMQIKNDHGYAIKSTLEAKIRPCVILSIDKDCVQVLPITTSTRIKTEFAYKLNFPELQTKYKTSYIQFNKIIRINKESILFKNIIVETYSYWFSKNMTNKVSEWIQQKILFYKDNNNLKLFEDVMMSRVTLFLKFNIKQRYPKEFLVFENKFTKYINSLFRRTDINKS